MSLLLATHAAYSGPPTCANQTAGTVLGAKGSDAGKKSLEDCCAACLKDDSCAAFTWDGDPKDASATCWLKDNTADQGKCNSKKCVSALSGRQISGLNTACRAPGDAAKYKFCDTSLSLGARVGDLVPRLKSSEMASQLTARESTSLDRLGIPAYYWGTNALHSFREASCIAGPTGAKVCPTAFPIPTNFGAAFNMSLARAMGASFGYELRALYNARSVHSLDTWSPTINIARDPRWGRNVEVPTEDPYLMAQYALGYTVGAQQGPDLATPMVGVTLKHWVGYSVEGGAGKYSRHTLDAKISAYDLASSYMPPFEAPIVDGAAMGVMCSYNMVNGKPTCGNPDLTKTLRDDWKYITSDTDACADIYKTHHYAKDGEHATADCLAGGTDVNSGGTYSSYLAKAVDDGTVPLADAQAALSNAYRFRMRLGLFDANSTSANFKIGTEVVGAAAHRQASLDTARQSMVLMKDDAARGLPFTPGKKLAVIGNDANNVVATLGNYVGDNICPGGKGGAEAEASASVDVSCLRSYWEELNATNAAAGGTATLWAKGSGGNAGGGSWDDSSIAKAVEIAGAAEQVLVVISNAEDEGGEGHDRTAIGLAADQSKMAAAVLRAVKPGAKAALALINGGVISLEPDLEAAAPSMLDTFMPGPYGAQAVAETVWGSNVPGGKLPMTVYFSNYTDGCDIDDMSMQAPRSPARAALSLCGTATHMLPLCHRQACGGRTYRYFDGPVQFPFGHGLSYTTFSLKWSPAPPPPRTFRLAADATTYSVVVANTGSVFAADEVVLAYFKPTGRIPSLNGAPVVRRQLFGFERVHLAPGASTTLTFTVHAAQLGLADDEGHTSLHGGDYELVFSRGCKGCAELRAPLAVEAAAPIRLKEFRKWW